MDIIYRIFIINLGKALALTIFIELIAIFLQKEKIKKIYLAAIIINIFTNISMNLVIKAIPATHYHIIVLGLEALVILIEFGFYYMLIKNSKKAFRISLICNISSYVIGLILMPFIY